MPLLAKLIKRFFVFIVLVFLVGLSANLFTYFSSITSFYIPPLPGWAVPGAVATIIVIIGFCFEHFIQKSTGVKYEFLNILSHKFRTSLTHIKWETENLQTSSSLSPENRESLMKIQSSTKHLVEMTDLLVSLADTSFLKNRYFSPEKTNLVRLIEGIVPDYKSKSAVRNIHFETYVPKTPVFATIDVNQIRLVIHVLLDNALIYTPPHGKIELRMSITGQSKVSITVSDTGIGISKKDLPLIFSRFFRSTKAKTVDTEGTGVGLCLADAIVKKHRGTLTASSPGENQGANFELSLPLK